MSNFYNQNTSSTNDGSGFYNSGGFGGYGQQNQPNQQQQPAGSMQQDQQQQPTNFANVQQWQQPSNQSANTGTANQQGRQQEQVPNFWNPGTAAAVAGMAAQAASGGFSNDAVLDSIVKGGAQAWQSGGASMIPGFDSTMLLLRAYFAVDNRYVNRKMQRVLFPFRSTEWKRLRNHDADATFALPTSDDNAPDLYLPVMSLVTYCLLCALTYGTSGQFNPDVIANVTTKCVITQTLEVLLIRLGFYMMQAPCQFLDLYSFTGYKYLGLTLSMLCGLAVSHLGYGTSGFYVILLWTAGSAAYFMLKTMANNIPVETASDGPKREAMVLAFAASQVATMWFLSQTKFL